MSPHPILLVGGSGVVGRWTARLLREAHPDTPLLIGGRNLAKAEEAAAVLGHAEGVALDLADDKLGLGGRPVGAVAVFPKDDTIAGLRFAQARGVPHISISYQISEALTFGGSQAAACLIEHGEPRRFAVPIPLRPDLDAPQLRAAAKKTKDGPQARRLLALAAIYDGATRAEAATIGGVTLQIVRDWVLKLNACGPEGLVDRKAPGQPSRLNDAHRAAIAAVIESGPVPAVHGVVRWRLIDLCQWLWEEHQITISKQTLSRELRAMNHRKLSARPRHHAQEDDAVEASKKASPPAWTRLRARKPSIPPGSKSGSATKPASARRTS